MPEDKKFLIKKHGYWYRPEERGYTSSAILAGRYSEEEAKKITHPNGPDEPRDGMSYIHEDDVIEEDWKAWVAMKTELRQAMADYMRSEGCSCCRGMDHDEHGERLAQLLDIPPYDDGSGYDFYQFCSER